ncbi:hypothetical protein [Stutzerimonas stutzeri]|uniref:hypothetical protein n=1 Tax=Stutzerimonas stutzeri TaxID=316 RepID=UPI00210A3C5C|nr:hypothetical protein [Stutzerimonas stutzeri]MCQ4323029.1 hypothetical protein [Stutzerimonas stutzeri]
MPMTAEHAQHLTVFQRTLNFTIPAANRPMEPEFERQWKVNYREWRRKGRESMVDIPYPASQASALDTTEDEPLTQLLPWKRCRSYRSS